MCALTVSFPRHEHHERRPKTAMRVTVARSCGAGGRVGPIRLAVAIAVPLVVRFGQGRQDQPAGAWLALQTQFEALDAVEPGRYDRGNIERKPARQAFCNGLNWLDRG